VSAVDGKAGDEAARSRAPANLLEIHPATAASINAATDGLIRKLKRLDTLTELIVTKIGVMIRKNTLIPAAFSFVAFTGSAHGEINQHTIAPARQLYPAAGASTQVFPGSSALPLGHVLRNWERAGFSPPSKPAQARVHGRSGAVISGGEYGGLISLIRSAIRDSAEGRDQDAVGKIARVRMLLAR
jgi:hypothetical protein